MSLVATVPRFAFGRNWSRFLPLIDDARIRAAEQSLRDMLGEGDLRGKRVVDVGSGSGLFSLAARRLGAVVHSFDYDADSVACTAELRRRYFPNDPDWTVAQGSILDRDYVRALGQFDVVYAWGVLHHTGALYTACTRTLELLAPDGMLFVAIYNDQGARSRRWARVKRAYNLSPTARALIVAAYAPYVLARLAKRAAVGGRKQRGMSIWYDAFDWLGGYPFEVAAPRDIVGFFRDRGLALRALKTVGAGAGNNEFVFRKNASVSP